MSEMEVLKLFNKATKENKIGTQKQAKAYLRELKIINVNDKITRNYKSNSTRIKNV